MVNFLVGLVIGCIVGIFMAAILAVGDDIRWASRDEARSEDDAIREYLNKKDIRN